MKVDTIYGVRFPQRPDKLNKHRPAAIRHDDPGDVFEVTRRKPVRKEIDPLGRANIQYPFRQMAEGEAILLPVEGLTSAQIKRKYKTAWQAARHMGVTIDCRRSRGKDDGQLYLVLIVRHEYRGPMYFAE